MAHRDNRGRDSSDENSEDDGNEDTFTTSNQGETTNPYQSVTSQEVGTSEEAEEECLVEEESQTGEESQVDEESKEEESQVEEENEVEEESQTGEESQVDEESKEEESQAEEESEVEEESQSGEESQVDEESREEESQAEEESEVEEESQTGEESQVDEKSKEEESQAEEESEVEEESQSGEESQVDEESKEEESQVEEESHVEEESKVEEESLVEEESREDVPEGTETTDNESLQSKEVSSHEETPTESTIIDMPSTTEEDTASETEPLLQATSSTNLDTHSSDDTVVTSKTKVHYQKHKSKPKRRYGLLHRFLRSSPEEYKMIKMCLGFPFGGLVAFALYLLIVEPMELSVDTRELMGGLLGLALCFGCAMSVQVRCIVFLLVPTFCGKAGRTYIGTYAIRYLMDGPVANMILNSADVSRSLVCVASLAANHTKSKLKFRAQPIADVLHELQAEGFMMAEINKNIRRAFNPLRKHISDAAGEEEQIERTKKLDKEEGSNRGKSIDKRNEVKGNDDEGKMAEKKYKKKLEYECEDIFNKGVEKCKDKLRSLEDKCYDEINFDLVAHALCWPLKIDAFCNIITFIAGALGVECDSTKVVGDGFGELYVASKSATDAMDQDQVDIQYKVIYPTDEMDYTTAEEMRKGAMHEFDNGKRFLKFIMVLIKRLLAFTFLLVVFGAYKYNKQYLTDIRFDNIYITSYFKRIDSRRKVNKKNHLLPLKRAEADRCIFPISPRMMKAERKKMGKGIFVLLARSFLSGMIFFTDHLLYSVLDIIRKHSRVDFRQSGVNHIKVEVEGDGFMAKMVKQIIGGFNSNHHLDQVTTNVECLPTPTKLPIVWIWNVYGIYILILLLMIVEAYGLRLRRLIAAFFYRKREKTRVLYCYNNMMKRRKGFLKLMKRKVKRKAKKRELSKKTGLLYALRRRFPRLCSCLVICMSSKNRCLICDDPQRRGFHACSTPGCNFGYCAECWGDIDKRCYACMPLAEFSDTDTGSDASLSDDDDVNNDD